MENTNTIYTPKTEQSTNPAILYSGWGGSSFENGLLSFLLGSLFLPWGNNQISVFPTLPEASPETLKKFYEETKDIPFEEQKEIAKKLFDPDGILDKYYEKLKNPKEAAKLTAKLIKQDAKIAVINQKKQEIVDKWVRS